MAQPASTPAAANQAVRAQIGRRVIGQHAVVDQLVNAFFAGGHCLLVGVPGLAKTLLVRTFAESLGLRFNRIQFTPDLMPSDITGTDVLSGDANSREFTFLGGPIFANIILADEINRTPPKTQASLLEAMEEGQITVAGRTYPLPQPFFVMATQNPVEQEGTYPLPLAALDRFLFSVNVTYPTADEERDMLFMTTSRKEDVVETVIEGGSIPSMLEAVRRVEIPDAVLIYATRLVRESRPEQTTLSLVREKIAVGGSPRAVQALVLAAKARAAMDGRDKVSGADVRAIALPALRHRIVPSFLASAEGVSIDAILTELVASIPRPSGDPADRAPAAEGFSLRRLLLGAPKPRRSKLRQA